MAPLWTCRLVPRTHLRVRPHTQLNINESRSTARKARPGGTAIYGFVGDWSALRCGGRSVTSAGVADAIASRMQNVKETRPLDVNWHTDGDYQKRLQAAMMPSNKSFWLCRSRVRTCVPTLKPQHSSTCLSRTPSTLMSPKMSR